MPSLTWRRNGLDGCCRVCLCRCVWARERRRRRKRGGGWGGRGEEFVSRQAHHPRGPPVNSGGQTISLIEFNPGSLQEACRLVAPLGMERAGGGGGSGSGGEGKSACIDGMMRRMRGGGRGGEGGAWAATTSRQERTQSSGRKVVAKNNDKRSVKGWRLHSGGGSKTQEARRNGSQLRFCMITAKTSFASGNRIQTCSRPVWLPSRNKPSLLPAAEIKDLLLDALLIYIWGWGPIMSHFHKHLVVHKEQAQIGPHERSLLNGKLLLVHLIRSLKCRVLCQKWWQNGSLPWCEKECASLVCAPHKILCITFQVIKPFLGLWRERERKLVKNKRADLRLGVLRLIGRWSLLANTQWSVIGQWSQKRQIRCCELIYYSARFPSLSPSFSLCLLVCFRY